MSAHSPMADIYMNEELYYIKRAEAEFKEFGSQIKFESRLKYGWFHLKLYSMFKI